MKIFDRIQEEVSIYDLFKEAAPSIRVATTGKPCQISCPFHGDDAHPSARVYPDGNFMRCYYCSESWDVIKFWAQINGWWRDEEAGKLDIRRAIDDLCNKYNINNSFPDWEKRFHAIKKQAEEAEKAGTPLEDRSKLASFYSWDVSQLVHKLSAESRVELRDTVLSMWDDFTRIDLTEASWQSDLICWYRSAKLDLYENRL